MVTGKVIYGILSTTAGVTALVSTKIYPHIAPQEVMMPFVTFEATDCRPTNTKNNVSHLDTYLVTLTIFDSSYTTVQAIDEAIRAALDQYRDQTVNSVEVDAIIYDNGVELYDDQANVYAIQANYQMRIRR